MGSVDKMNRMSLNGIELQQNVDVALMAASEMQSATLSIWAYTLCKIHKKLVN